MSSTNRLIRGSADVVGGGGGGGGDAEGVGESVAVLIHWELEVYADRGCLNLWNVQEGTYRKV